MHLLTPSQEQIFSKLFHATAQIYRRGEPHDPELIDAEGKAFLASIGYTEKEFFEFIDDATEVVGDYLPWYRKGAEQGDITAQSGLGYMYASGRGVVRDYAKALYWYQKAADSGDASAQSGLGYLYANGFGVTRDHVQSAYWYHQAAEKGSVYAQLHLGHQYRHGQGVPQNDSHAAYWYRKAAGQGNPEAAVELKKLE